MKTNRASFIDICELIKINRVYDESNHYTDTEERTEVFCNIADGVSRAEYYEAMKAGIKAKLTVEVNEDDYEQQTLIEIDGKRYSIGRTYPTGYGTLELTCSEVTR